MPARVSHQFTAYLVSTDGNSGGEGLLGAATLTGHTTCMIAID
jgi:hypothetical protein